MEKIELTKDSLIQFVNEEITKYEGELQKLMEVKGTDALMERFSVRNRIAIYQELLDNFKRRFK